MLSRSILAPVSSNSPQKRIGFKPASTAGFFFARVAGRGPAEMEDQAGRLAETFTTATCEAPTETWAL